MENLPLLAAFTVVAALACLLGFLLDFISRGPHPARPRRARGLRARHAH